MRGGLVGGGGCATGQRHSAHSLPAVRQWHEPCPRVTPSQTHALRGGRQVRWSPAEGRSSRGRQVCAYTHLSFLAYYRVCGFRAGGRGRNLGTRRGSYWSVLVHSCAWPSQSECALVIPLGNLMESVLIPPWCLFVCFYSVTGDGCDTVIVIPTYSSRYM